jgi:hypothetical protein
VRQRRARQRSSRNKTWNTLAPSKQVKSDLAARWHLRQASTALPYPSTPSCLLRAIHVPALARDCPFSARCKQDSVMTSASDVIDLCHGDADGGTACTMDPAAVGAALSSTCATCPASSRSASQSVSLSPLSPGGLEAIDKMLFKVKKERCAAQDDLARTQARVDEVAGRAGVLNAVCRNAPLGARLQRALDNRIETEQ